MSQIFFIYGLVLVLCSLERKVKKITKRFQFFQIKSKLLDKI